MAIIEHVSVKKNERGLLLRNGDFQRMLHPGMHRFVFPPGGQTVELFSLEKTAFFHPLANYFMAKEPALVAAEFTRVDLGEHQVGLRLENGVLVEILPPTTRRLYWKGLMDVQVQVLDISQSADVPDDLTARLVQPALRERELNGLGGVLMAQVPEHSTGLLSVDGKIERLLPPGSHAFWRFNRQVSVEVIDMRLQSVEVSGQDILTRDKVMLRINLSGSWRFSDPLLAHKSLVRPSEHLYRELQLGLRAAVGTRTLDELLDNKTVIDDIVSAQVTSRLAAHGLSLESAGVKDIILPGDMKTILAKVVEAGKAAEANVIRRREETAATRSLLNTAKVMEDNPVALRLKELETLEHVAERIDKITVFGGLDQVLNGLIKIR